MKVKSELAWSSCRLSGIAMSGSAPASSLGRCPSGSSVAEPAAAWFPEPPGAKLVETAPGVGGPCGVEDAGLPEG
eukprot:12384348-Heterocapsa_arctica.AAC.1